VLVVVPVLLSAMEGARIRAGIDPVAEAVVSDRVS
jgi:hypothetical protein